MFENPRRGRQVRNFTTNAPKILGLKSSSEQIFSRKLPLGVPACDTHHCYGRFIQLGPGVHFPKLPEIFRARKVFFSVSHPFLTILGNLSTVGKHTYRSC